MIVLIKRYYLLAECWSQYIRLGKAALGYVRPHYYVRSGHVGLGEVALSYVSG